VVVPERHDQDHGAGEGVAHLGEATLLVEDVLVAEGLLLGVAVALSDGVAGDARDGGFGVGDDDVVLDVEALDLRELAVGALEELGHDCHLLGGVDGHAGAVESLVALTVRVEVTACFVSPVVK